MPCGSGTSWCPRCASATACSTVMRTSLLGRANKSIRSIRSIKVVSQHRVGQHRVGTTRRPSMVRRDIWVCVSHGMLHDGCRVHVKWEE